MKCSACLPPEPDDLYGQRLSSEASLATMIRDREKRRLDQEPERFAQKRFFRDPAIPRPNRFLPRPPRLHKKPVPRAFRTALRRVRGAALAGGVDAATFDKVTRGLTPNPDVLAMAEVQPEFKTPIWDYLAGLVDEEESTTAAR